MIDIFKLERLNVDAIDWGQYSGTYDSSYWGKLVVDKYSVSYFNPDGTRGQNLICGLYDYSGTTENLVFDHRKFLDQIIAAREPSYEPNDRRAATTPLDVELLIKLKQGGHTADELVTLREAGII